jgi:hypothetical protein
MWPFKTYIEGRRWEGVIHSGNWYTDVSHGLDYPQSDDHWYRGNAAVSVQRNQFVVDNVRDGFNMHQLDNGAYIRTLPTGNPKKLFPQQVAFGEDSKVIVGGSDHG